MENGININVGTEGASLDHSSVTIGTGNGRDATPGERYRQAQDEISRLLQRVHELEQFVFGDEKLGLIGIRQELKGLKFWIICNTAVTVLWALYEIYSLAASGQR